MAIAIKLLASGHLPSNPTNYADLTTAVGSQKAQIIKNMRFYNTTGSSITLTVALSSSSTIGGTPDEKVVVSAPVPANNFLYDDKEMTLEATQKLRYKTSASGVDFIVSGIERDA